MTDRTAPGPELGRMAQHFEALRPPPSRARKGRRRMLVVIAALIVGAASIEGAMAMLERIRADG